MADPAGGRGGAVPAEVMAVLAATVIPSAVASPEGRFVWVNEAMCSLLGRDEAALLACGWGDIAHPDEVPGIVPLVQQVMAGERPSFRIRARFLHGDGTTHWGDLTVSVARDEAGEPQWMLGQIIDISDQVVAEQALEESEERYRLLAENVADVVGTGSSDGRITWVSESVRDLLGLTPQELIGRPFAELVHPEDREAMADAQGLMRLGQQALYDARLRTATGRWRWVRIRVRPAVDASGASAGIVASWQDINDRVEATTRLESVLGTDGLTGLPNRATMEQRMLAVQSLLDGPECHAALLCIGIDRLGDVNSAINHAAGDHVLATVARRIAEAAPDAQLVGRGAGVDFLVLLPDLNSTSDAVAIAERMRSAIKREILVDHRRIRVTASIGIASCHQDVTPDELIRSATLAMHAAKDQGRDRLVFDDPQMREEAERLMTLAEHARDGIAEDRFLPWFMPIVDLHSRETVGFEALMRWDLPGGVLEPKEFMTALIQARLMAEVDRIILRKSLDQLATLPAPLFMSINVSSQALAIPGFGAEVLALVRAASLDPARVHLELTETMLFRPSPATLREMHTLAEAGVRWYVDDFGTGYSSLSHLHDLPISGLKLDGSFTAGLATGSPRSAQMTQALAGFADGLDLDTVAEGIETTEQAEVLEAQGWRRGQGWLFGRPAPAQWGAG